MQSQLLPSLINNIYFGHPCYNILQNINTLPQKSMLKYSSNLTKSNNNKIGIASNLQANHHMLPTRQNKIYSQRQDNIQSSTKRLQTYPSEVKTHRRKGSSLLFSKNLFKDAKKVNTNNPKQSFLPMQSQLTDNKTKIKILLSAYSKLQNKSKVSLSPKSSKIHKLYKTDSINEQQIKNRQGFRQPALSSLTRLILNECKIVCKQNSNLNEQLDSSLNKLLLQQKYSQWINILCEQSIIPHQQQQSNVQSDDNPYQLFIPKISKLKQSSRIRDPHIFNA